MKKIYKSLTVSAIVATVSLSALPQSLAITHESQPTKQQRTVGIIRSFSWSNSWCCRLG